MSKKSYRQAINEALRQEMERDHRVILMGEDVSGGTGTQGDQDAWGGPLGVTSRGSAGTRIAAGPKGPPARPRGADAGFPLAANPR